MFTGVRHCPYKTGWGVTHLVIQYGYQHSAAAIGAAITAVVSALKHQHVSWHLSFPQFVTWTASWHLTTTGKWLLTGFAWYVIGARIAYTIGERLNPLGIREDMRGPGYSTRWNLKLRVPVSVAVGLAIGLLTWLAAGLRPALGYGFGVGLLVGLLALRRLPSDLAVASPKTLLARDRSGTLTTWPPIVLTISVAAGAIAALAHPLVDLRPELAYGLVAAGSAAVGAMLWAGAVSRIEVPSWPNWLLAHSWLALTRQLAWRLMKFLAQAHKLGVLRQTGPIYQFRHIELEHRLASHARMAGAGVRRTRQ